MPASPFRRRLRWFLLLFWGSVVALQLWFFRAHGFDAAVLASDATVAVHRSDGLLTFAPRGDTLGAGLLFFPGALVAPEAYAPMAHTLAEAGHLVVIVPLPQRLAYFGGQQEAVFARAAAQLTADARPPAWVVGGHSRGGALAARFAASRAAQPAGPLAGLLLVGTSHPRESDLSGLPLDVTKVYGTKDGLASPEEVQTFARLLPPHTVFVAVDGGNHAGFGWYGPQLGDGRATLPRAEQQRQLADAVRAQLLRVAPRGAAGPNRP